VSETLDFEMRRHRVEPFPDSIEKGLDYGEMDPVMIDADIFGWASRAESLSALDKKRLAQAKDELERSIHALPPEAQAYYERLVRIAGLALAE
jgi:hypothetical protein